MPLSPHITFILNPVAGRGRARHLEPHLASALKHSSLNYSFLKTTRAGEATLFAREASTKSSIIVAIGGDGTVNEVATGVVGTPAAVAVINAGSGNDFARLVNATADIHTTIESLRNPTLKTFDAGKVLLTHNDGRREEKYFFNSLGLGFDAAVAKKVSSIRWMRGDLLYLTALFHTLAGYKPHDFLIRANNAQWSKKYFLLCIGNGKWEGGGFKLTPDAEPDDGKFQVCGVTGNSILQVLPVLPSVMTGTHIGKKFIEVFDAVSLIIESSQPFPVHGDGEIFGFSIQKAQISILPSQLNVVVTHADSRR